MHRFALPLLCVLALSAMGMALADPFQDSKWKIKLTPDGDARSAGEKEMDDVLSFKGGMFTSEAFAKRGFKPAQYEEDTRRFGPAMFKAESESESQGKAVWSGTVTATAIKGELVWTKKDGTALNYSYTGEKAQN